MNHLTQIANRHTQDRWKDAVFIAVAVLLTALSIGAVTSKAAGNPAQHVWTVTVIESELEIAIAQQTEHPALPASQSENR
jgi:hypothetical protein